ncbi:PQQ-dependent catabolism-associated CXXCW motif protein [Arvimicrobium flavum]|uniref:PQQ-dependent catabolism-associated CXXCW motif protein n=1 Tax=Arvimicrobium flavum TaxID=3393320 RepID=UPI00237BF588|nr:PQQ-dependent catabolism-associated CXXCW motif protein [Mesorhizobium shangrilense]
MTKAGKAIWLALVVLGSTAATGWTVEIVEPAGYRMDAYKAPVPATLQGATVVSTADAQRLWREKKAVFFDVMPHTPKPANLPSGTVWKEKDRQDIPGSIWLANVGYGAIPEETAAYFQRALDLHTGSDKTHPVLFYCMTDCWMSWNAAKRAIEWGYRSVLWYPSGADGWEKANLPLEENRPYAVTD